jgi:hypothetical protein
VGIINRRNAVAGWLALSVGKRVLKKKAKQAVPAVDSASKRPNRSALLVGALGLLGAVAFWRKHSGDEDIDDA